MTTPDENVLTARLQKDISSRMGLPLEQLVFNFILEGDRTKLELLTINPRHNQSFLCHSLQAPSKLAALEEMLAYVTRHFREEASYTLQWSRRGIGELHTSYFRARDMYEVLDKFSYGRDLSDYTIYTITLNPMT